MATYYLNDPTWKKHPECRACEDGTYWQRDYDGHRTDSEQVRCGNCVKLYQRDKDVETRMHIAAFRKAIEDGQAYWVSGHDHYELTPNGLLKQVIYWSWPGQSPATQKLRPEDV